VPPQRRKIVPPVTTSKVRKKVAGTNRKPTDSSAPDSSAVDSGAPDSADLDSPTSVEAASTVSISKTPEQKASVAETAETETPDAETPVAEPSVTEPSVTEPSAAEAGSPEAEPAGRTNWVPTIVIGAVAALLVAFAAVAALKPGTEVDNAAWVDQGETSEVTRATSDALVGLYRYNFATIDADIAAGLEKMTPAFREESQKFIEEIKSTANETQTATDVDVLDIGVVRLQDDKAELFANINVSATSAGVASGNVVFPLIANMEKIDGQWLLSATQDK
jgi:Mce-associated membrane protein